jgi:hypothetical protein
MLQKKKQTLSFYDMQEMQFLFQMKCITDANLFLKCKATEKLWNYFRQNYENENFFFSRMQNAI